MQLLSLIYKMSKNDENRVIGGRNTRQQEKCVLGAKHSNCPFYKGCMLWNILSKEILAFNHSIHEFYKGNV